MLCIMLRAAEGMVIQKGQPDGRSQGARNCTWESAVIQKGQPDSRSQGAWNCTWEGMVIHRSSWIGIELED